VTDGSAPVPAPETRLLLVHRADARDVAWPPLTRAVPVGEVLKLELAPGHVPRVHAPGVQSRLLDRHFYVYRHDAPERRSACERALFDAIADQYDNEIDEETNRRTIRRLLGTVAAHGGTRRPLRVLDFGCGTGLAAAVADPDVFHLLGTDASDRMLHRAARRGMSTVSLTDLPRLGAGWADGAIASFVLHLAVPAAGIATSATALRAGGVLAANFHKGRGRDSAAAALAGLGLVPVGRGGGNVAAWIRP